SRAGAELQQRAGWAREAAKGRVLPAEIRSVDRRVSEVVAISDAGVVRQLEVILGAVDGAELLGRRDRIAPREAAGQAGHDAPPMRVHDTIRAAAAEWTRMGD